MGSQAKSLSSKVKMLAWLPRYLNAMPVGCLPASLLGQNCQEFWLQLWTVETLQEGILGQHHVVVNTRGVQHHAAEQLYALKQQKRYSWAPRGSQYQRSSASRCRTAAHSATTKEVQLDIMW